MAVGPEKAIETLTSMMQSYPILQTNCHGLYETVGRSVVGSVGLVPYYNSGCQFGYTHGVLYALGHEYDDIEALIKDVMQYCKGFANDPNSMNGPDNACYHGLGHALADVTKNDPLKAVQKCEEAFEVYLEKSEDVKTGFAQRCVDGVFMQYGDGNLMKAGMMPKTSGNIDTYADPSTIAKTCQTIDKNLAASCYLRIWKFLGPGSEDYGKTAEVCLDAPDPESQNMCQIGFGELVAWETKIPNEISWPPTAKEDSDAYAKILVDLCYKHPIPVECVYGVMSSINSHLYSTGYEEELISDFCALVRKKDLEVCEKHETDTKNMNWDKTSGEGNETGLQEDEPTE